MQIDRTKKRFGRPKLRYWTILGLAWCAVSALPCWFLLTGITQTFTSALGKLCIALILPHLMIIVRAIYLLITEKPKEWFDTYSLVNPEYDPRKVH